MNLFDNPFWDFIDQLTRIGIQIEDAINHDYSKGKTKYTGKQFEKWHTNNGYKHIKDMETGHIKGSIEYLKKVPGARNNVGGLQMAIGWVEAFEEELTERKVKFTHTQLKIDDFD